MPYFSNPPCYSIDVSGPHSSLLFVRGENLNVFHALIPLVDTDLNPNLSLASDVDFSFSLTEVFVR